MVALSSNHGREIPSSKRGIRVFAMDLDDGPALIFVRNPSHRLRRQVKGKLARLSRLIETAGDKEQAEKNAERFSRVVMKAIVGQCLGAAWIADIGPNWEVLAEIPSDLDEVGPARLGVEHLGYLLAALDLAP